MPSGPSFMEQRRVGCGAAANLVLTDIQRTELLPLARAHNESARKMKQSRVLSALEGVAVSVRWRVNWGPNPRR